MKNLKQEETLQNSLNEMEKRNGREIDRLRITYVDKTELSCKIHKTELERCRLVSDCFSNGGRDY